MQKNCNAGLVLIDKRRPEANKAEVMNIIGDVEGKDVLIVDDLIDTAGTFVAAVNALKKLGAAKIYGAVTHPMLSGQAIEKLESCEIDKLFVSDTIPQNSLKPDSKDKKLKPLQLYLQNLLFDHTMVNRLVHYLILIKVRNK